MDVIIMFLVFLVLYYCYAIWTGRISFMRNNSIDGNKKSTFSKYVILSSVLIPVCYFLLFVLCLTFGWVVGNGLFDLEGNSEVVPFLYVILAVAVPTLGLFPVKLIYFLIFRNKFRLFNEEKFTAEPKFFSLQGRIGRLRYFGGVLGIYIVVPIAWAVLVAMLGPTSLPDAVKEDLLLIITIIAAAGMVVMNAFLSVKRIHDLDRTRTHAWLLLVPLYNIYFGLLLLYQKGSFGDNRFGPDPVALPINTDKFRASFNNINIDKFSYIICYSYEDSQKALNDYNNLKAKISDYDEKVNVQFREYTNNGQYSALIAFFSEDGLKFDSLITWLGNGDYRDGRALLSTDVQIEYSGLKGYLKLFSDTREFEAMLQETEV